MSRAPAFCICVKTGCAANAIRNWTYPNSLSQDRRSTFSWRCRPSDPVSFGSRPHCPFIPYLNRLVSTTSKSDCSRDRKGMLRFFVERKGFKAAENNGDCGWYSSGNGATLGRRPRVIKKLCGDLEIRRRIRIASGEESPNRNPNVQRDIGYNPAEPDNN